MQEFQLCFVFLLVLHNCRAGDWGYSGDHGPSHWSEVSSACGGSQQSPIDISSDTVFDPSIAELKLGTYDTPTGEDSGVLTTIKNSGHSAQVDFNYTNPQSFQYFIRGGGLRYRYNLEQLHFHWGSVSTHGSEHTLGSRSYALEAHFVHYRSDLGNVSHAKNFPNGLAVLGVLVEVGDKNPAYNAILDHLVEIIYKGQTTDIPTSFTPSSLLPSSDVRHMYYRYQGSLTTPSCDESVEWTVFASVISMSEEQLMRFRGLFEHAQEDDITEHHLHYLDNNFRPVQPIGERVVYSSFPRTLADVSTASTASSVSVLSLHVFTLASLIHALRLSF